MDGVREGRGAGEVDGVCDDKKGGRWGGRFHSNRVVGLDCPAPRMASRPTSYVWATSPEFHPAHPAAVPPDGVPLTCWEGVSERVYRRGGFGLTLGSHPSPIWRVPPRRRQTIARYL